MNVEELKEKARRHELREEWQKAFDLYSTALRSHDEEEAPDITLYNRVGDIQTRLGQINGAVEQYEKAIELYLEAELPNNAIAICKKVLRNLPDRSIFFLRMGQIRASQGFLTDARHNFLNYAERQTALGDVEGALNALVEFIELSPEDVEIRQSLAAQLETHGRKSEAVVQFTEAHRQLTIGGDEEAARAIAEKLEDLAPDLVLPAAEDLQAEMVAPDTEEMVLESTSLGGLEIEDWREDEVSLGSEEVQVESATETDAADLADEVDFSSLEFEGAEPAEETEAVDVGDQDDLGGLGGADVVETEEDDELPSFEFESEDILEETEILPSFGFGEEGADEAEAADPEEDDATKVTSSVPSSLGLDEGMEDELPLIGFEDEDETEFGGTLEETEESLADLGFQAVDEDDQVEDESAKDLPFLPMVDEEEGVEEPVPETEGSFGDALEEALQGAFEDASVEVGKIEPEIPVEAEEMEASVDGLLKALREEEAPDVGTDHKEAADRGDMDLALQRVAALIETEQQNIELYQRQVEYAFRKNDQEVLISAYIDLAGCLATTGAPVKARAVYLQVLSLAPGHDLATAGIQTLDGSKGVETPTQVASSEEYVDLGSMILGDDAEEGTRWTVAADAPSGDEAADFAKMLGQFKDKVSEHVAADDVTAHHDLGTAYMEMGLFDEAIGEFQAALRASPDHLPTHEVMGRCWMEMENPSMAVRALERALRVGFEVEDELIGIYYLMGRAQEDQGNSEDALEFYEKVFSLDINFEDVTERLRALR